MRPEEISRWLAEEVQSRHPLSPAAKNWIADFEVAADSAALEQLTIQDFRDLLGNVKREWMESTGWGPLPLTQKKRILDYLARRGHRALLHVLQSDLKSINRRWELYRHELRRR